ncbi:MAG: ABC transporter ATP-binding protein [bacterium]|nr:ABC transporter ATP-binding protein [bacterium]
MFALMDVTKTYDSRRGAVHALQGASLVIEKSSFVTVTGPSGSGKTTLLLTLGGLIRPSSGQVLFNGSDLGRLDERSLAQYRNRHVGFVLQSFNLIPYLSALENVMVPMSLGSPAAQKGDHAGRARARLDRLGLADRLDHLPRELSVGQQQRVAIARALSNDPEVILADEPTGNLDPLLAAEIMDILRDLNEREGRTVVVVTHSPEAAKVGRQRIRLEAGGRAVAEPNGALEVD